MLKVGITGGIGSGKTTVCKIFQSLGVPVYYADDEAKKLYDSDEALKQEMIKFFGPAIYPNGYFDRHQLKAIVFNDEKKLHLLNQLVHPRVIQHAENWMKSQTAPYVLKEAALLIESTANTTVDKVILVSCALEKRIERVIKRDHTTRDEILQRAAHQLSDNEKRAFCDYEIVNDNTRLVIPQVLSIHESILSISQ